LVKWLGGTVTFPLGGSRPGVRSPVPSKPSNQGARLKRKGPPAEVGGSKVPWGRVSKAGGHRAGPVEPRIFATQRLPS
jgi:hypothetical protein